MPAGIGASYRSLGDLGEDVYKSTTIVDHHLSGNGQSTGHSVLESVKKAFTSFTTPKVGDIRKKDPLIEDRRETISIVSRYVALYFSDKFLAQILLISVFWCMIYWKMYDTTWVILKKNFFFVEKWCFEIDLCRTMEKILYIRKYNSMNISRICQKYKLNFISSK